MLAQIGLSTMGVQEYGKKKSNVSIPMLFLVCIPFTMTSYTIRRSQMTKL